jgi:hypothetical protein
MAIYKNISSKYIINKIMRDLKPNDMNWIDDAIEWIGEALEHIGATPQLETKNCVLSVANYKVCLPNDFYLMTQVATNTSVSPDITSELSTLTTKVDALKASIETDPDQNLHHELREIASRIVVLENIYFREEDLMTTIPYGTSTFMKSEDCIDCAEPAVKDWYIIENGYIKTSFKSGEICVSYKAFPVDEDCYPMVPDDVSYREAMFWYVFRQMLLGGYDKPTNKVDYNFADQKWRYYCTQARNSANYPDIDRYESFLNQWVRLIPNLNRHADNFEDLGKRENLYRG